MSESAWCGHFNLRPAVLYAAAAAAAGELTGKCGGRHHQIFIK